MAVTLTQEEYDHLVQLRTSSRNALKKAISKRFIKRLGGRSPRMRQKFLFRDINIERIDDLFGTSFRRLQTSRLFRGLRFRTYRYLFKEEELLEFFGIQQAPANPFAHLLTGHPPETCPLQDCRHYTNRVIRGDVIMVYSEWTQVLTIRTNMMTYTSEGRYV